MHSHLSWRLKSSPSLPTTWPSHFFMRGSFTLSLYTQFSLPVLYGGSMYMQSTRPSYSGSSAFNASRLSPWMTMLPQSDPRLSSTPFSGTRSSTR